MNESTTSPMPPPPPPPRVRPAEAGPHARLGHPVALFAVAGLVGLVAAIAIGTVGGLITMAGLSSDCSPGDGWCGLGAALAGLFIAAVIGGGTYIATGVAVIVRCRASGRRAAHIVAHVATPIVLILLAGLSSSL